MSMPWDTNIVGKYCSCQILAVLSDTEIQKPLERDVIAAQSYSKTLGGKRSEIQRFSSPNLSVIAITRRNYEALRLYDGFSTWECGRSANIVITLCLQNTSNICVCAFVCTYYINGQHLLTSFVHFYSLFCIHVIILK